MTPYRDRLNAGHYAPKPAKKPAAKPAAEAKSAAPADKKT